MEEDILNETKVEEKYYSDNGPLMSQMPMEKVNGEWLPHGMYTEWYRNGIKRREVLYVYGSMKGDETIYYNNGVVGRIISHDENAPGEKVRDFPRTRIEENRESDVTDALQMCNVTNYCSGILRAR